MQALMEKVTRRYFCHICLFAAKVVPMCLYLCVFILVAVPTLHSGPEALLCTQK